MKWTNYNLFKLVSVIRLHWLACRWCLVLYETVTLCVGKLTLMMKQYLKYYWLAKWCLCLKKPLGWKTFTLFHNIKLWQKNKCYLLRKRNSQKLLMCKISVKCWVHSKTQLKRPTCSACLEAGLTHLILQFLVLCGNGLPNGDKTSHSHVHCLAHPVYGCQGALWLLWFVFMVD